jgi:hypothetical protein
MVTILECFFGKSEHNGVKHIFENLFSVKSLGFGKLDIFFVHF